jgi:hypothetical protein
MQVAIARKLNSPAPAGHVATTARVGSKASCAEQSLRSAEAGELTATPVNTAAVASAPATPILAILRRIASPFVSPAEGTTADLDIVARQQASRVVDAIGVGLPEATRILLSAIPAVS